MRPDACEVCDGVLEDGELVRQLLDFAGGSVYGHLSCIDGVVEERLMLGQLYLGDVDLGGRDPS